jgi:hypothetical protein
MLKCPALQLLSFAPILCKLIAGMARSYIKRQDTHEKLMHLGHHRQAVFLLKFRTGSTDAGDKPGVVMLV